MSLSGPDIRIEDRLDAQHNAVAVRLHFEKLSEITVLAPR